MKKFTTLTLLLLSIILITGCNTFSERRYGEGDVVRVLINPSGQPQNQHFMNLQIFNDSNEEWLVKIEGFETLENEEWVLITPFANEDWMTDFLNGSEPLEREGERNDRFGTIMSFDLWLHPDYPTTGDFRASIRVYDLNGNYQFTQASNVREIQYFTFN